MRANLNLTLCALFAALWFVGCLESPKLTLISADGDVADTEVRTEKTDIDNETPVACQDLCDCAQGWFCNTDGVCEDGTGLTGVPFCCDNPGCIGDAPCLHRGGAADTCPAEVQCSHQCDCPQGWYCNGDGQCDDDGDWSATPYCCDNPGCNPGSPCISRAGETGVCPTADGDGTDMEKAETDSDADVDLLPACRWAEDCPPCHACLNLGGVMTCVGIGDYECMPDVGCALESYCKPFQATHPECGGICEVLAVYPYELHEWGVNIPNNLGGAEQSSGPDRYWGAIPAKPVIYLYADQPMTLDVGVHFASGGSTETWPELPNGPTLWWHDLAVSQGACATTATPQPDTSVMEPEDKEVYQLANWVVDDADCLTYDGVVSKLLFYTGRLDAYVPPLVASAEAGGDPIASMPHVRFTLTNTSEETVKGVILLYRDPQSSCVDPSLCPVNKADIAWDVVDSIAPGATIERTLPLIQLVAESENNWVVLPKEWKQLPDVLRQQLLDAGLYEKEVNVFMSTWKEQFFGLFGADSIYSLPGYQNGAFLLHLWTPGQFDDNLPLLLDPQPTSMVRVMVEHRRLAAPATVVGVLNGTVWFDEYEMDPQNPVYHGPASAATVSALQKDSVIATATSCEDGSFTLKLPPGVYDVTATRNAWETGDRKTGVLIVQDAATTIELTITSSAMVDKPNLYLYPSVATAVSVAIDLAFDCEITTSIPTYGNGWQVWVEPSGRIDGKYDYLFYEAEIPHRYALNKGWTAAREDLAAFFRETLESYGFNARETQDFVDYWPDHVPPAPYYAVYPLTSAADLDPLAALAITPTPDSLFRLWLVIKPLEAPVSLDEPVVSPMMRAGFAAVEWGVIIDR